MGVTVTPLGFRKPDGNEPIRNGDNEIAANAQKAQDLIAPLQADVAAAQTKLAVVERAAFDAGAIPLIEDPDDPGFYLIDGGV